MDGIATPPGGRDGQGRFAPGQSGNPAGKPPGTRNRGTLLREFLRDGEADAAARVIIDKATGGNLAAARFVIDGIAPKARGRLIELGLADDASPAEAVAQSVRLATRGEITADEARLFITLLREQRPVGVAKPPERAAAGTRSAASPAPTPESDLNLQAAARVAVDQALAAARVRAGAAAPVVRAAALKASTSLTRPRLPPVAKPPPFAMAR